MDLCVDVLDGLMSQLNSDENEAPDASVKVKRKGILHLFTGGVPKFQKSLVANRLHVCCVLFHEDRILMTNDDALPMVVVDENLPGGGPGLSGHHMQHVSELNHLILLQMQVLCTLVLCKGSTSGQRSYLLLQRSHL